MAITFYTDYDIQKAEAAAVKKYKKKLLRAINEAGTFASPNIQCNYFKNKKLIALEDVLEIIGE